MALSAPQNSPTRAGPGRLLAAAAAAKGSNLSRGLLHQDVLAGLPANTSVTPAPARFATKAAFALRANRQGATKRQGWPV